MDTRLEEDGHYFKGWPIPQSRFDVDYPSASIRMEQAAQLKAEKVKIALQKIKEANIQKIDITNTWDLIQRPGALLCSTQPTAGGVIGPPHSSPPRAVGLKPL
ncbi:hypothetical protein LSH36_47g03038 [Paralvinella palmiformis]|uniref:Uncharacterized protein n=1 Tax=Paralvinella palmiformis TaxID=53620 RepID=A0AAD9K6H3_9ANNE|nr:hypothetical protein LSH36_47g03038 [Paralvinella palmiformis]